MADRPSNTAVLAHGRFFGVEVRRLETETFRIVHSVYRAHSRLGWHAHQERGFFVFLRGEMREDDGFCYQRGNGCYLPAGFFHELCVGESDAHVLNVGIKRQQSVQPIPSDQPRRSTAESDRLLEALSSHLASADSHGRSGTIRDSDKLIGQLAAIVLSSHSESDDEIRDVVANVCREIHQQFSQPLNVAGLAERHNRHPGHLARHFRQRMGCSISAYLNLIRLRHACHALAESDEPIVSVASRFGFFDQSHLTRKMCGTIGVTPAQYRRRHRTSG